MTDQIEITEEVTESANTFLYGLRRVLMAGIGAVALTQEQIEDFLDKLVERGEIADSDARKLLGDVLDRRKKILQGSTKKAEEEYDKRVEGLLSRMNIPTKGEIESLSEKIADLGEKVDELNRKRQ
ncbi:MAG: phasin family protein [Anaerolineae bacterium]|uniref:phasin family protein n=1 Tax=Promineifilum sp. TaxID=2664178 RepID=UPI001D59B9AB|nr:phasin family protein [Anaerolineales bacterium]MCB8934256.1 phasin family protein [Promineifilum sp.]MCO5179695.1 phasin family protein [Promineifilum sp.]MCW5846822.1 phasin family protein [Anaerolineae bacterium]